jgi:hypothetical protein
MKKKPINKFDTLVDKLVLEFNKIPILDLTQPDNIGNKVFNIITIRLAEVSSYKDLVCSYLIPATNKAILDSKVVFQNSRYKVFFKTNQLDFQEILYETVRLAYVGLFHKLENFINNVVKLIELIMGDLYETDGTVFKWAKDKFNFDIKDWRQFYITYKINWISNCVKHKDGFPVKLPKPKGFENVDESQRIKIKPNEFKRDCELLIQFYPIYLQTIFLFAQHKLVTEKPLIEQEWQHSPDLYKKQVENINNLETQMSSFVNILKQMK